MIIKGLIGENGGSYARGTENEVWGFKDLQSFNLAMLAK